MTWSFRSKSVNPELRQQRSWLNTHRHHYLFALAEQYGVLQHVVRDGGVDAVSRRHGGDVEAKQPLELIQCQYKMLLESLFHKLLQLHRRRVGRTPRVTISVVEGAGVAVHRAVDGGGGRGGVHGFVFPVADRFLFDLDAAF